jgi:cyclopropane fatty-acyl-phospholipid synthase-like methyltransferase
MPPRAGPAFTEIAHRDHLFCNPLDGAKVDELIELLDLKPGARVLDVGCGKGEALVRIARRYRARATGVDASAAFLAEARERARAAGVEVRFLHREAARFPIEPAAYDLALCVGATQLFGGYRGALKALAAAVAPGGQLLLGEGFWKKGPSLAYLRRLGARKDDFTDHRGNVERAVAEGLVFLYASVSSDDDWDRYEGLYNRAVERWALEHPDHPEAAGHLERVRRWRDTYLRWGRDTLGFALYLFQVLGASR